MYRTAHVLLLLIGLLSVSSGMAAATPEPGKYLADSLPARWSYTAEFSQTLPSEDSWWKAFEDPMLDSLISEGIERNYNVLMACHRMEIARQTLKQVSSQYYPALNLNAGWTKSRSSGAMTTSATPASTLSYFSLGVDMNWQIDLFGKITAQARDKKALWQASRAQYVGTMVSIGSSIASCYMSLRVYQAERRVAMEHLESQKKVVEITEARHEAGLVSMLDVSQARTVYYSTEASLPPLESAIRAQINAIAVLMGKEPGELSDVLDRDGSELPEYHHLVPVGFPESLLRRRPDIVEAEYNLAARAAELGIAKKDFLPTLSLNGSIGTQALKGGDLFRENSWTYSIAPTLSWNLFDGFARRSAVVSAREMMEIGIEEYNMTVLTAVQEVDNAMAAYSNALKAIEITENVVKESQRSFDLSIDLYKQGLTPFTNVVDAQMNLLQYSDSRVTARGRALQALVDLYKALGGGFDSGL